MVFIWAKQASEKFTSGKFSTSYFWGEVEELKQEIRKRAFSEALKEWDDVVAVGVIWLSTEYGINLPLFPFFGIGAVRRWEDRQKVWAKIFEAHGLTFDKKYLEGGSNYKKQTKWVKAFNDAGYEGKIKFDCIGEIQWEDKV